MLALSVTDVKGFMVKLLKGKVFDDFQLRNAVVNTFARFEIFGANENGCATWGAVKPHVYGIIRGGTPPKSIKVIFAKEMPGADADSKDATSLFINMHFEDAKVNLTTGVSKKGFSLDKSDERAWDAEVLQFLDKNEITYINEMEG